MTRKRGPNWFTEASDAPRGEYPMMRVVTYLDAEGNVVDWDKATHVEVQELELARTRNTWYKTILTAEEVIRMKREAKS
jgi:hypothetical protein